MTTGMTGIQGSDHGPALRDASRQQELNELIDAAFRNFEGDIDMLEKAVGMLMLGDYVGWRVLVLVHSKSTLRRYESILGIRIREFFPEEGPLAGHSEGYRQAIAMAKFWKVANGDISVEHRRTLRPPGGSPSQEGERSSGGAEDDGNLRH